MLSTVGDYQHTSSFVEKIAPKYILFLNKNKMADKKKTTEEEKPVTMDGLK